MGNVSPSTSRAFVVTVSDRSASGEREDGSGPVLEDLLRDRGYDVVGRRIVADGRESVANCLRELADDAGVDLIVTTGGTGLAPRDLTPEGTLDVADRLVPGLMELARRRCIESTPFAALSRGVTVIVGSTLVVNLPGNPRAASETFDAMSDVLPHALDILSRPVIDCDVTGRRAAGDTT